jgi:hypothetical protein
MLDKFSLANCGFVKTDLEGHEEAVLHRGPEPLKFEKATYHWTGRNQAHSGWREEIPLFRNCENEPRKG